MKIKVEIDIQNILDEMFENLDPHEGYFELDLKDSIRDAIVGQTKREILKMQNTKITEQIQTEVKKLIEVSINDQIKKDVEDFSKNGKLTERYSSDEPISVNDWVKKQFEDKSNSYKNTLFSKVQEQASKCVKELKERYDLLFASQIISKLNDQDLLKEGVFKSLMEAK